MKAPSLELRDLCRRLSALGGWPVAGFVDPDALDHARWYRLVYEQQLGPLLGSRLLAGQGDPLPAAYRAELVSDYRSEARKLLLKLHEIHELLALLSTRWEFRVLKGWALPEGLYRCTAERPSWDIDLLFRNPEEAAEAHRLLLDQGYREHGRTAEHHHLPALHHASAPLGVELHTNLTLPLLDEEHLAELWSHADRWVLCGVPVQRLDAAGRLLHHALHAHNDPVGSPLLRNLFECGWLAGELTELGRQDLSERAARYGVADRVARMLQLGSKLLGSPTLFAPEAEGVTEYWCRRRLEWGNEPSGLERVWARIAEQNIELINAGTDNRNWMQPGLLALGGTWQTLRSQLGTRLAPRSGCLQRADYLHARIGRAVLVHDGRSGEAHLLNELTARIWDAAEQPQRGTDLVREVSAATGLPRAEVQTAVNALTDLQLLAST